jgi:predicted alpha-1,2-mannosidase
LEYSYDDWTIYRLGKALNKPKQEIDVYAKRALNYKNLYYPKRKLMAGRASDGSFSASFKPTDWGTDLTEGNSWHYSWSVFHDPQGLIDLMGGKNEFVTMLDSVFIIPGSRGMESRSMIHEMREMQVMDMGQYAHGNQPIQHMVYLYNYAGAPWKTQYWAREIMDKLYSATPDGYCGDEDNGQTSAWYVFSALGFYPVCPGSNEYVLGSPLFKSVKIELGNGKEITITADNNSLENRYITEMNFNGKKYTKNYVAHEDLMKGAKINFTMSPAPDKSRGIDNSDFPYSFSREK